MNTIFGNEANPLENPKSFTVPLNADHEVVFTYKDPFGLIVASCEGFTLPTELEGQFTSYSDAKKAVNTYLTLNPNGPVKVKAVKKAA